MNKYSGKNVLITGGLGFIGSNLAIRMVESGANVTIVDSMIPGYGGNMFNIEPVKDNISINICDISDKNAMEYIIKDKNYIFHLAGQVNHMMGFKTPYPDVNYNITGTVILLEACRRLNSDAVIVFSGTRGQYGQVEYLPVPETAPQDPKGLYEITKLAAEKITIWYHKTHGIKSIATRLTNVYGPRAQMKTSGYGVANWFIRLAIDNEAIPIYGNGLIKRDFIYVDDLVEALTKLPLNKKCYGEIFNIGNSKWSNFKELAELIVKICGKGFIKFTNFPEERKIQEPGDFYPDISKISSITGWVPSIQLEDGIKRTIEYYEKYKFMYW
jgi:UDP-glucose 4-epimerase